MRFLSTLGRLPGTWAILVLAVLSGGVEGIGISLFMPLLHIMAGNNIAELPRPFSYITTTFQYFGVAASPIAFLFIIVGLSLGALALVYLQRVMLSRSTGLYSRDLRDRYFKAILGSTWDFSSQHSHGEVVNNMTTECARSGIALGFELTAAATLIQITIFVVFSMVISIHLMAIAAGFAVLIFYVARPLTRSAKILGEAAVQSNKGISLTCLEYLQILKLIKASASNELAVHDIQDKSNQVFRVLFMTDLNNTRLFVVVQALPILLLAVIIGVSHEIMNVPVTVILVFLLFLMRIAPRIGQLQQQLQSFHQRKASLRAVNEIIEETRSASEELNPDGKYFERLNEAIVLDDITFKYSGGDVPAINGVSMTFESNKMVAIVGASGCGKSTVMDIITGIRVPDSGGVYVDHTNLNEFQLNSWRRRIGIVTQDTATLSASLRDNLIFFNQGATDSDIAEVLSIAHLEDVVNDLPDGLNTILGEHGVRFSGGQIQRIALARALLRKPELLLLDEATNALDNESEIRVQNSIAGIASTMTTIIVAHRLSTIRRADKIYVMDDGRIAECGTYDELMDRGGLFAKLRNIEIF